jgi:hypothetical protein
LIRSGRPRRHHETNTEDDKPEIRQRGPLCEVRSLRPLSVRDYSPFAAS